MKKLFTLVILCIWFFQIQAAEDKKASSADTTVTKPPVPNSSQKKAEEKQSPSSAKEIKSILDELWWEQYRRRECVT
jgi:hypothetical protein